MLKPTPFAINHPDYTVVRLTRQDNDCLQALFVACTDFFLLTEGMPPSSTAAHDEFTDAPDGKSPDDLHFFGLGDAQDRLVGVITTAQCYPDDKTWWLGLMLLAPDQRGLGLGSAFYHAFEAWLISQKVTYVALSAIASNTHGRAFWHHLGFEEIRQTSPCPYGQKTHTVYVYRRPIHALTGASSACIIPGSQFCHLIK